MRCSILMLTLVVPTFSPAPPASPSFIDAALAALWREKGVAPSGSCTDAEFLRRLSLDLVGAIPSADEAQTFIESKDPEKRAKAIDTFLTSASFLDFWSARLTATLIGYPRDYEFVVNRAGFQKWMHDRLADGAGWNTIATDLVTATGAIKDRPEVSYIAQFLEFNERGLHLKIEELTGRTSSVFLGLRLRCAQCHDHPHDRWTQEDFFGMAAYFQKTDGAGDTNAIAIKTQKMPIQRKIEGWKDALVPKFVDLGAPESENLRLEFAEQLARHDQFARAFVNRLWACFFGRGIVNPYDDFAPTYKPVAPALLDALAKAFRDNQHDIRWLIRAIVSSNAYQVSSRASDGQDAALQEKFFARARVRPMTPDQLWNAIDRATGLSKADVDLRAIRRMVGTDPAATETSGRAMLKRWFMTLMVRTSNPDAPAALGTYTANVQQILQALNVNSPIWAGVRPLGGGALDEILLYDDSPASVVAKLYLAALGRAPTDAESRRCIQHVDRRRDDFKKGGVERGLEEVFWALLNTDEFIFNH
jgi:hypothetical protein